MRLNHDQSEFFYSFRLDEAVPDDHRVRAIAAILDLSWVHSARGFMSSRPRGRVLISAQPQPY